MRVPQQEGVQMDTTAIDSWISAYEKAWRSDAPEDIAALFEPDASYLTAPFRDPYVGRDAIATWWIGQQDSAIPWTFDCDVLAIEGPLHVVKGVTTYPMGGDGRSKPEVYDNIWLVTLAASGRATEFVEYWMLRK
jgi:uncharacterized protein (TIGR02246 family)